MKVIAFAPIYFQNPGESVTELGYLNFDSKNVSEVRQFQRWMNERYKANLPTNGKYTNATKKAFKKYGAQWEQEAFDLSQTFASKPGYAIDTSAKERELKQNTPLQYSESDPRGNKKPGMFWDKVKGGWVKAKDSGLLDKGADALRTLFGMGAGAGAAQNNFTPDPGAGTYDPSAPEKRMSTTTKIVIGVAVVGAISLTVYMLTRKGKTAAPALATAK